MTSLSLLSHFHSVYFRKPDMDTLLAAALAGVSLQNTIICVTGDAPSAALNNPEALCLECGGSGQPFLLNFDHHGTAMPLPPACMQVWNMVYKSINDSTDQKYLAELVSYVSFLDTAGQFGCKPFAENTSINLSSLISGILLISQDRITSFQVALSALQTIIGERVVSWNMYEALQRHPEWQVYFSEKQRMERQLKQRAGAIVPFETSMGQGLALLAQECGVHGFLRGLGATVSLASKSLESGIGQRYMHSISVSDISQEWLREKRDLLNAVEGGWGGPSGGTIIASAFEGSFLSQQEVICILKR